jgi:hypothetical protein
LPSGPKYNVSSLPISSNLVVVSVPSNAAEYQKEQKAEYEYIFTLPALPPNPLTILRSCSSSALLAKRVSEKTAKIAAVRAAHHKA